jgi:predicted double-glycine peptidase
MARSPAQTWFYLSAGTVSGPRGAGPGQDLGPGDSFGTEALLGLRSPADVLAVTAVDCLCLPRSEFERLNLVVEAQSLLTASVGTSLSWVGQQGATDCAAAALTMAARRLGHRVRIEDVHKCLVLDARGAHMESLARAAGSLGLTTQAVQAGPEALNTVALPAIALLAAEHFVVVYEIGSATVLIGDPARGVLTLGREEFFRRWSGNLLLLRADITPSAAPAGDVTLDVSVLNACFEKTRTGDAADWDSLLGHFGQELERAARQMLRDFQSLLTAKEQCDLLEAARLRLRERLQQSRPDNLRQAVRQAADQTRLELAEIVRLCQAAQWDGCAFGKPAD